MGWLVLLFDDLFLVPLPVFHGDIQHINACRHRTHIQNLQAVALVADQAALQVIECKLFRLVSLRKAKTQPVFHGVRQKDERLFFCGFRCAVIAVVDDV